MSAWPFEVWLALALLLAALVLAWVAFRRRHSAGLPAGRVAYTDTGPASRTPEPLFDPDLGLVGKPDYLIRAGGGLIPVEVKSGRAPAAPYESHLMQLAAYCRLVHAATGRRPPRGVIHYEDRDFSIDYTPALEARLRDVLAAVRRDERSMAGGRSHAHPRRCRACGYAGRCDQRLD